ncbi:YbhB/YbcL family Raf kinase inhibitor-like protein [Halomonas sp. WWR20]
MAEDEVTMRLFIEGINQDKPIPGQYAFAVPDADQHFRFSDNRNPQVVWDFVPEDTRSFALLVIDPDVPSDPTDVNQEGKTVPRDLPRVDFYHWVLVDIPAHVRQIDEGEDSDGVVAKGKAPGRTPKGVRGINSYTDFFAGDPDLEGVYGGYDGPCPPWNDERLHHYHFILYALDVETLGLEGEFTGEQAREAMQGHVLAQTSIVGTYTLSPQLT